MVSFRLLIDYDVVVFIESLPKATQRVIRDRLAQIRDHPSFRSDYTERDAVDRPVEINLCGSFAIKFWVDHADRHIKVLDIHPADRRR